MAVTSASFLAIALFALCATPHAWAAESKVASGMGHDLAVRLCSQCHLVEPGQTNPPDHVGGPSFQSVANRPEMTKEALRTHLRETRVNRTYPFEMPNPNLTDDQLTKVISYISSLRSQTTQK